MALTSNSSGTQEWLILLKDKFFNLVIVTLLLLLIMPVCCIFFSSMHLMRLVVKFMANIFRRDLGSIIPCGSVPCALSKNTAQDTGLVIMVTGICEGTLDAQQVKQCVRELLETKNTEGKQQYPELTQFPISWMGYYFWCWDTDFNLDNHVHLIESNKNITGKNGLKDFVSGSINEPVRPGHSPWNIFIVNNVSIGEHNEVELQNKTSALILKMSHILGDGYSIVKLFERLCKVTKNNHINLTYPAIKKGFGEKILFPFKTLYFLAEGIRDGFKSHPNYPLMVTKRTFHNNLQVSESVSVEDIKKIKAELNVSFTSVVIALATGSIQALLLQSDLILPKTIPCLLPIQRPGHPSNLSNHYFPITISLPIGEQDHIKRVRLCHQEFQNVKSSPEPFLSNLANLCLGGCIAAVGRKICADETTPVVISYLPLDWSTSTFSGCNLKSLLACLTPYNSVGLSLTVVSFQNNLIFSAVFDSGIITEQTASSFGSFIKNEVHMLKDTISKSKICYGEANVV